MPDRIARLLTMTVLALSLILHAFVFTGPAQADGSWRSARPMETARSQSGIAVVSGEIYVAGGASVLGPRDAFEVFDPIGEIWRPLPAMPEGREQLAMAPLGSAVVLSGGLGKEDTQETVDVWQFNTATGRWQGLPDLPLARAGHAMVQVDGRLYVLGGSGPDAQAVFVFDSTQGAWSRAPWRLPKPLIDLAAVADGNRIYILGGRNSEGPLRTAGVVDAQTGSWRDLPAMPRPRAGHTAVIMNGRLHVTGGVARESLKTWAEHDVFDVRANRWTAASPLPTPRQGLVSAAVNGRWYVVGGGSGAGVFTVFTEAGVVEVYEP